MGDDDKEEKYKKFNTFDWTDERWQAYYDGLYPPPNHKQVVKFKKKWYKKTIDPEFDDTYEPGASTASAATSTAGSSSGTPGSGPGGSSSSSARPPAGADDVARRAYAGMGSKALPVTVGYVLGLGLVLASAAGFADSTMAIGAFMGTFAAEILAKHGFRFSQDYLQTVVMEDVGVMPFMCITFMTPGLQKAFRTLAMAPVGLTALLSLAMLCKYSKGLPGPVAKRLEPLAEVSARYQLLQVRCDLEVLLLFAFIIGACTGRLGSPLTILLYGNVLMIRYQLNAWTQASFRKLDMKLSAVLGRIPVVDTLYSKFKGVLSSFMDPTARAGGGGGGRCTIL